MTNCEYPFSRRRQRNTISWPSNRHYRRNGKSLKSSETAWEGKQAGKALEALGKLVASDASLNIFRQYRILSFPTTFFVGRDGVIRSMRIGRINEDILTERIQAIQ